MPKPIHPADIWTRGVIDNAVEWTAFMQAGRVTRRFDSRAAAEAAAQELADQHNRPAIVYAIDASGRSAFVDTFQPRKDKTMTTGKPLSSTEISQLTAIITGGGFKRANSKEAAERRFIKLATEAGIAAPELILSKSFADAERTVRECIGTPTGFPGESAASAADYEAALATIPGGTVDPIDGPALSAEDHAKIAGAAKTVTAEIVRRRELRHAAVDMASESAGPDDAEKAAAAATRKAAEAKPTGKRAAALEAAQRGEIPEAPDFSAETHKRFRKKLAEIVALVEAGDVAALKAVPINPVSSSPKAMAKYRDLAVTALQVRASKAAA